MKKNQGKVYRDKLNQLEGQLTAENRHYFDDLRMYMSMAGLLLDEGELNIQLYQLAADLLAAQADGVSAVDYFGNQPQEMADEMLANTKKARGKSLFGMILLVVGILWGVNLIGDFSLASEMFLSIPQYFASALLGVLGVGLLFLVMKKMVFSSGVAAFREIKTGIAFGIVFLGVIAGQLAVALLLVDVGIVRIPFPVDVLILGGLAVGLTIFLVKAGDKLFYPVVFFLYVLLALGVVQRLLAGGFLTGSYWHTLQSVVLIGALVVWFVWQMK
uniref:hypothetical protein n=1 Tax=Enterococcus asini TaxID=57732 RepID=UPI0026DBC703